MCTYKFPSRKKREYGMAIYVVECLCLKENAARGEKEAVHL